MAVAILRHPALLNTSLMHDSPSPALLSPLAASSPSTSVPASPFTPTGQHGGSKPPSASGPGTKKSKKKKAGAPNPGGAGVGHVTPQPLPRPVGSYALLRDAHATALKLTIAKMRHEQWNNGYLRTPELRYGPWQEYDYQIQQLERELGLVEAARETLDAYPICYAPTAEYKAHGPQTKEEHERAWEKEVAEERRVNMEMDKAFPFIQQQFVGPLTKKQAQYDKMAREMLKEGDAEDLEMVLEEKNKKMFLEWLEGKQGGKKEKKSWAQERLEREEKRVKEMVRESKDKAKAAKEARAGKEAKEPKDDKDKDKEREKEQHKGKDGEPGGKQEEVRGTKVDPADKPLLIQREQRHAILAWLREPWSAYDDEVADMMKEMGEVAVQRLMAKRGSRQEAEKKKVDKEAIEKARLGKEGEEERKQADKGKGGEAEKEEKENGKDKDKDERREKPVKQVKA